MADTITNDTLCQDYAEPVGRLLAIGETSIVKPNEWPNYPEEYGLGSENISDLIRMACDLDLHTRDSEGPAIWAPVHAWRALAQLRATEAIQPLLQFTRVDLDDDAVAQEFAIVFGMIGPAAMAPITAFLSEPALPWMAVSLATDGLVEIVNRYPECRNECVEILTGHLKNDADLDPTAIGFAISSLLSLKAVEAIDVIREAFRLHTVDISIAGDLEDVEIDLGLRARRTTRKPNYLASSGEFEAASGAPKTGFADIGHETDYWPRPVKIGRNEPCPCGSGIKYKKCCLV